MMKIAYTVCVLTFVALHIYGADESSFNQLDADDYLEKYGYLSGVTKTRGLQRSLARTRAIQSFQQFAHLPVTGELDDTTKKAMIAPRCGMTDVPRKTNRAGFVSKWQKQTITWALTKPTGQINEGRVRSAIKQALEVWRKVTPLDFTEVSPQAKPDMQFGFGPGDHGDSYNFDGPGGVLAHAFFPSDGRLHFDDEETWTFENATGIANGHTDLLSVTIHELGHSLGLPHSKEEDAIMYPFYRHPELDANKQIKQFVLSKFDIQDIQDIYGPRQGGVTGRPPTPAPTPAPTPPGGPSSGTACQRFQAAVTGVDGATYFFLPNNNIGWTKKNAANGAPNSATKFYVDKVFPGAPSNGITAAVTDRRDQLTILLQGRRVYGFRYTASTASYKLEAGYPKDLQNDVPFTPEGAFQLREGHLILYQGDQFVIWDAASNKASFKNSIKSYWGNLPAAGKTSFAVGEDRLYFLDASNYIIYDFYSSNTNSPQPLKTLITC